MMSPTKYVIVVDLGHPSRGDIFRFDRGKSTLSFKLECGKHHQAECRVSDDISCLPLDQEAADQLSWLDKPLRLEWIFHYHPIHCLRSMAVGFRTKKFLVPIKGKNVRYEFCRLSYDTPRHVICYATGRRVEIPLIDVDFGAIECSGAAVPTDSSLKEWKMICSCSKLYNIVGDRCEGGQRTLRFRSNVFNHEHSLEMSQIHGICQFNPWRKEIELFLTSIELQQLFETPAEKDYGWSTVNNKRTRKKESTTKSPPISAAPPGRHNLRPADEPSSYNTRDSGRSCDISPGNDLPRASLSETTSPPSYDSLYKQEDIADDIADDIASGHSSIASQSSVNDVDVNQKSLHDDHVLQMTGGGGIIDQDSVFKDADFPELSSTTAGPTRDRSMSPVKSRPGADTEFKGSQSSNTYGLRSMKDDTLYPSLDDVNKKYDPKKYGSADEYSVPKNGMKVDAGVLGATTLNSPSSGPTASHDYSSSSPAKLDFVNSGYTPKSGDFCRIHNLERSCTEPHFGTVRAIVTVPSSWKTCIGLELVKSCGCSMTTDGTYSKKSYFKTNSKQALFVPPTFLELLFPKSGEEIPIKELDLVRAVIPMPNHKHKVLDAIVQDIEDDLLILQACQMEERMFEFKVDTLKVCGKFPNPRNPEKFHIRLPKVFARRLFSPSKVCDGDICEMFVPDFATFQALVQCSDPAGDPKLPTYTIELLDSDLPAGIEFPRGIQLIHGNVYSVKAFYLRSLHQTLDDDHHGEAKRELVLEPIRERQPALASITRDVFGRYKGIQGLHNSCYMDSLFFSLFLFNSNLDNIFEQLPTDSHKQSEVKQTMRELIINPLRKVGKHFVSADHMMKLRNMLEADLPGVSCEEKDAEELLSLLFSRISGMQPLLAIWNDVLGEEQNLFLYQMFVETDEDKATRDQCMPSLHNLLIQSFLENGQTLLNRPDCLLLQLPRFGKEKIFPAIFTPIHLDLLPISQSARRSCVLCGEVAQFSCTDCYKNRQNDKGLKDLDGSLGFFYCNDCWDDLHGKRKNHKKRRLDLDSEDCPMRYELQAVLCIRTSHYVCFVRTKDERNQPAWVFFDSMSDRDERSQNVPAVKRCPEFEHQLGQFQTMNESHRNLMLQSIYRDKGKEELVRLLADAYICMYKRVDDTESPTPEWAGPETFDHALRAGHSHTHKPSETLV